MTVSAQVSHITCPSLSVHSVRGDKYRSGALAVLLSSVRILVFCHLLDCVQTRLGFPSFSIGRPPPCWRPSTCWCLLEAWVSPRPPVRSPQHSDRASSL
ncbi:hypothetical protein DPX16_8576 [Anabarilius grahami]|uniref:Uncharacterized protein n=1 Tax=Anabarilius grahami TaxID=495550 RepID=A0A3N0YAJ4_ANAGA|nr:hypothetical protein DPX16_8576 [Anabarilius grahami]